MDINSLYAIPVADLNTEKVWIETTYARHFTEAEDKFIDRLSNKYDTDIATDIGELRKLLSDQDVLIGEISIME